MGEAASRLADRVILTSDNPRSEDPMAIIDDAMQGVEQRDKVVVEPDRRAAIAEALAGADAGDLVLVAGKGHEQFQEIRGERLPFDDRVVVREEYERMNGASA